MTFNINSKILLSVASIAAAAALVIGATFAFFSDTETSTGNTFTAGKLDLKVDNTCYYNKLADGDPNCSAPENGVTSWESTDLGAAHKFFYFTDVKPGDFGEDTVSLTVDNDAWLRMLIGITADTDNTCTGPESAVDPDGTTCGTDGELLENLLFTVWLDEGVTPGFQGPQDLSECDNDFVVSEEPTLISEGTVQDGEIWNLADFGGAYLLADQKSCFGIAWRLPEEVGNAVQTDGVEASIEFQVEQQRNNPSPFPGP